jgi:hypothetical protein
MDLSVVPTIGFDLLYAFVVVRLDRRELMWINVTANPTGRPAMIAEAKIRIRIASTSSCCPSEMSRLARDTASARLVDESHIIGIRGIGCHNSFNVDALLTEQPKPPS